MKPQQCSRPSASHTPILLILGLLAGLLSATQCPAGADPLEGRTWVLQACAGKPVLENTTLDAGFANGQVAGSAGVNTYYGAYAVDGPSLTISDISTTKMMGEPEPMRQEWEFLALLRDVAGYAIDGDELRLLDAAGATALVFRAADAPAPQKRRAPIEGKDWVLISYLGRSVIGDTPITARFGKGEIKGTAGVNDYYAAYELRGDRVEIKRTGTTRQAGTPEAMQQETTYLDLLGQTATYRVAGYALELRDKSGALLLLYRAGSPFWRGAEPIRSALEPYETRGCVMVPFRAIAEWLGASVKYTPGDRTVRAVRQSHTVDVAVGSRDAAIDGQATHLSHRVSDGRSDVFVPLELIRKGFGVRVHWFANDQVVLIRDGARKGALYPQDYWHGVVAADIEN